MDAPTLTALIDRARARRDSILKSKGDDYTRRDQDRLSNFKRIAAQVGVSPLVVWFTYYQKHVDAIATYVQNGSVASENIEGRFDDAANYLDLGLALVSELQKVDK